MSEPEYFDPEHIHTTPEGRHFRHGDGVEVDGVAMAERHVCEVTSCNETATVVSEYPPPDVECTLGLCEEHAVQYREAPDKGDWIKAFCMY